MGPRNGNGEEGIRVYLRVRPSKKSTRFFVKDDINESILHFNVPKEEDLIVNNSRTKYSFQFNGILDEKSKQDEVFKTVGVPAVLNALDGFNSTIFAYGQTGSGKTFTITGGPERYVDRGIIPRAISMIFNEFDKHKECNYCCYVSYLELYNESGFDLLAAEHTEVSKLEDMPKVIMREDEDGNLNFKNLSVNSVANEEEALNYLFLGDTNRAIGETDMNQASSRSHCIFTLSIECRKANSETVIRSKLNLVDLAGSERVHKTSSTGQVLREAQYINTSLFFLEMVIVALHEKSKKGKERIHIPYRNSMMTSVLRDSLGGNCKTLMIATISPDIRQTDESISTCNFAQRVALVKNTAQINEELEPELIIHRLKVELKRQREEIKFLKGENGEEGEIGQEERSSLEELIRAYIDCKNDSNLDIGKITLTKISEVFSIFKRVALGKWAELSETNRIGGPDISDTESQLLSCKEILKQRDQEIAILVNMVKQGKKIGKSGGNQTKLSQEKLNDRKNGTVNKHLSLEKQFQNNLRPGVCGVERCKNRQILEDPPTAFTWFEERCPTKHIIEENKSVLKLKYQEAKDLGADVQKTRDRINYLKSTIEQLRREKAMQEALSPKNEKEYKNNHIDEEELTHRKEIDRHKIAYKDGFRKLKELKATIEHIQKLLVKNRKKLQTDFDIWYREMCGEAQESVGAYMKIAEATRAEEKKKNTEPTTKMNHNVTPPSRKIITGNREADEDIIAFFKAKEALLARTKSQRPD